MHNKITGDDIVYKARVIVPENVCENQSTAMLRLNLTVNDIEYELFRGTMP